MGNSQDSVPAETCERPGERDLRSVDVRTTGTGRALRTRVAEEFKDEPVPLLKWQTLDYQQSVVTLGPLGSRGYGDPSQSRVGCPDVT